MDASELLPALSSSISSMFALLALEFIFIPLLRRWLFR